MWFWDELPRPWELVVCSLPKSYVARSWNPSILYWQLKATWSPLLEFICSNLIFKLSANFRCHTFVEISSCGLRQWKRKCLLPSINSVLPVWVFWLANLVTLIQDVSSLSNWARNISVKESLYTWSKRDTFMKFVTIETAELGASTDRWSKVAWSPLPHSFCSKLFLKPWAKMRCQTFVKISLCGLR